MQANKKKPYVLLFWLFVLLAVLGPFLFWQLANRPVNWYRWGKPDPVEQVGELIRTRYVDEISLDSLPKWNLDSLSSILDPHSVYLAPQILRSANEDLAGKFAGIGIEFILIRDTAFVSYLKEGSPGKKAGLKTGDQLIAIDENPLTGPSIGFDSIRNRVRGLKGTYAHLTIRSGGKIRKLSILRDEIPTPAVSASYLLDDTTGYIQLNKFSTGSYRETVMAIEKLLSEGMKSLILDLRSNGGGFLYEAVELADEFLSEDRLIVYTEGAHQPKRSYFCKRPGLFEKGRLTILINEHSASATEVLAGALQDWCRAKVIGRKSYGKGLVQEQYSLSNGGALRLTVARYFTPLGRCIQRPYRKDQSSYLHPSSPTNPANAPGSKIFFVNPCQDTLFAEGGIQPDQLIPSSGIPLRSAVRDLLETPEIIQWSYRMYVEKKMNLDTLMDWQKMVLTPPISDIKAFFQKNLPVQGIAWNELRDEDWDLIGFEFVCQFARFRSGPQEYIRLQNTRDLFLKAARISPNKQANFTPN